MKLRQRRAAWRRAQMRSKAELAKIRWYAQWNEAFQEAMKDWTGHYSLFTRPRFVPVGKFAPEPEFVIVGSDGPARLHINSPGVHNADLADIEARIIACSLDPIPAYGPDTGRLSGNRK